MNVNCFFKGEIVNQRRVQFFFKSMLVMWKIKLPVIDALVGTKQLETDPSSRWRT